MGAASQIAAVPPNYLQNVGVGGALHQSAIAQQIQANQVQHNLTAQGLQAAWANQANQAQTNQTAPAVSMAALSTKASQKISRALDLLPVNLCAHIVCIEFWRSSFEAPARFTVAFTNGHKVSFDDVDNFPAEEHIARIALECP